MPELKKLSDLERKALALLGEKPADHQAVVHAILNKTYVGRSPTKREPTLHELNRETEKRLSYSAPSSAIAASLVSRTFVAEEWIPDAYVLFTRHWRCRCGQAGTCLDRPELFLRHHHIHQRKRNEQENGPTIRYLPVKVLALEQLPRLREVVFKSQTVCENCFEHAKGVVKCQEQKSSVSDATASPSAKAPEQDLSDIASTSQLPSPSVSDSKDINTGFISMEIGSDSRKGSLSELISAAFAELTNFHTSEGQSA